MIALADSIQPFWLWFALACILLAAEALVLPAGFLLCLGSSAALVAGLLFFAPGLSQLWALTLFAFLSVLSGLFWWKIIRTRRKARAEEQEDSLNLKTRQLIGYRAVLDEAIRGGRGRIRVNDSLWPAEADADYPAGVLVEVAAIRGITLHVRLVEPEGKKE